MRSVGQFSGRNERERLLGKRRPGADETRIGKYVASALPAKPATAHRARLRIAVVVRRCRDVRTTKRYCW
jgi:hypothetical protein